MLICQWSMGNKNYYELLGLQRDCTTAEIKESFIRLSKELHPDKNPKSLNLHQQFVAVNEAYSVLSRPHLRCKYDAELASQEQPKYTYSGIRTDAPREKIIFQDETLWEMRDKSEDHKYEGRPYYGIHGVKKLPNSSIAAGAVIFMMLGAILHFFFAKKASDFAIEQLNERDRIASEHYKLARQRALTNGNEMQIALLRERSESNSFSK
ncbi:dnaJ homolog subfamily C member 4-like isoform X2 [Panulirus ornatus]|uniref:dnaJ homolog subfamily C member 4-like isoform X2 n=1 Tax=Panulirus ornatus TaxID=150431 RepID=UPI003A89416C